jgi:hypothetical protein
MTLKFNQVICCYNHKCRNLVFAMNLDNLASICQIRLQESNFMRKIGRNLALSLLIITGFVISTLQVSAKAPVMLDPTSNPPQSPALNSSIYLPLLMNPSASTPPPAPLAQVRRVNAPFFNVDNLDDDSFSEMAIFWYGKVISSDNYTDVRVSYNKTGLHLYFSSFDRRLWYDTTPSASDLTAWDSFTVYLNTSGNTGSAPNTSSYRFDSQINWFEARGGYQASYRGNGTGWSPMSLSFTTYSGWKGNGFNDNQDDRGSAGTFFIPYASLGLSGPPSSGTIWGMTVVSHDRDDSAGTPISDKTWPESAVTTQPSTWGQIHFGSASFTPLSASAAGTVTIRHKLNGATVTDAAVGGTTGNLCPGDASYIWNGWGSENYSGSADFNIQNQSDIADWPCFAKYFITVPLGQIPAGKVVLSASLILHQWGNSGPFDLVQPSYIQVMTVKEDWSEATLTWNNAPLAFENISQLWVPKIDCSGPSGLQWPCTPRTWDVSQGVSEAYNSGQPLRLVLYSTDSDYHSGKLFTASDTDDWNETGRPTLTVTWGNP